MRFFQFVRCLSILAVFAIVASSADTDWQLASSLFTLDTSDEDWSLADPSTEVDDAVSSKTYQSLDPFSPDDDQLFVNDPQAGWLADVPPEECSSSGLAGKKRLTRSDGACSAIRVPNNNQQLSGQRSIPTDFDKIKCGAGLTSPLVLVCSSRKIMVALPYSMLFDSTRIFDAESLAGCLPPGEVYCCGDWAPYSPPRLSAPMLLFPMFKITVSLLGIGIECIRISLKDPVNLFDPL